MEFTLLGLLHGKPFDESDDRALMDRSAADRLLTGVLALHVVLTLLAALQILYCSVLADASLGAASGACLLTVHCLWRRGFRAVAVNLGCQWLAFIAFAVLVGSLR